MLNLLALTPKKGFKRTIIKFLIRKIVQEKCLNNVKCSLHHKKSGIFTRTVELCNADVIILTELLSPAKNFHRLKYKIFFTPVLSIRKYSINDEVSFETVEISVTLTDVL